ncbi:MAG TPA: hypothetical protein VGF48_05880 [Thermoanaerobaculia bacterium]|jgi:hypothetical protein
MDQLSQTRLAEITAKSPADLTEADAAFLRARRSYLNDEQLAVFADVLAEVENGPKGPYDDLSMSELRRIATQRNVEVGGEKRKADYIDALTAADAAQSAQSQSAQ